MNSESLLPQGEGCRIQLIPIPVSFRSMGQSWRFSFLIDETTHIRSDMGDAVGRKDEDAGFAQSTEN